VELKSGRVVIWLLQKWEAVITTLKGCEATARFQGLLLFVCSFEDGPDAKRQQKGGLRIKNFLLLLKKQHQFDAYYYLPTKKSSKWCKS
jgi:hypothetical protein